MHFKVGLPRTKKGRDNILVVVDLLSSIILIITCHTTNNSSSVTHLFPLKKISNIEVVFDKEDIEENEKIEIKKVKRESKDVIKAKAKIGGRIETVTRTVSPLRFQRINTV